MHLKLVVGVSIQIFIISILIKEDCSSKVRQTLNGVETEQKQKYFAQILSWIFPT